MFLKKDYQNNFNKLSLKIQSKEKSIEGNPKELIERKITYSLYV